jgi:prevent-host-death family protein
MPATTITSRKFNQDASRARRAADHGPVFITDRGRPAHVLMTIEEYRRLTGARAKIADLLAMPTPTEVELPIPQRRERPKPSKALA